LSCGIACAGRSGEFVKIQFGFASIHRDVGHQFTTWNWTGQGYRVAEMAIITAGCQYIFIPAGTGYSAAWDVQASPCHIFWDEKTVVYPA